MAGDGREPAILPPDARVSMNLWGFTPAFHRTLQAAMDAATDASEEAEVLLPEVVAQSLATSSFTVLPASGRCIGVTHPDDLSLVQAELNRQVAAGERPAKLWASLALAPTSPAFPRWVRPDTDSVGPPGGPGTEKRHPGPGATQPRVTVRPKPPVLLGATSAMGRWHRSGIVSDNPGPGRPRRLQGSHRDAPRTISVGSSCPLRSRSPRGSRSLSSIPLCSVLSASPRSALRLPFGLPSLLPCGARLRFGGLLSPN